MMRAPRTPSELRFRLKAELWAADRRYLSSALIGSTACVVVMHVAARKEVGMAAG